MNFRVLLERVPGHSRREVHLIVVHHHLRPGGVRRVIELALPHLMRVAPPHAGDPTVTLACGETAEDSWLELVRRSLDAISVTMRVEVEPTFRYLSEQQGDDVDVIRAGLEAAITRLLAAAHPRDTVVWAHNLGLGRNLLLGQALVAGCAKHDVPLIAHHHDWWFDNRWQRWPAIQSLGFRQLRAAAQVVFPASPRVRHAAINCADAMVLERHFEGRAAWLPNLMSPMRVTDAPSVRRARKWMTELLDDDAPVWLVPCRMLRRKNIAEGLLLARWLRPEAWVVTTGGPSSPDEQPYYRRLVDATARAGWRLRMGVLVGSERRKPSINELLTASEAVMLTSLQEGFGLPYLEAAATGRPLIARSLPNIAPDLRRFGFTFPQLYRDVRVSTDLLDAQAERDRQWMLFRQWRKALPTSCRRWVETPAFLASPRPPASVPFSRLTLTGQLEVLEKPAHESWRRCAPLNPFLAEWKHRAGKGGLQPSPWPATAEKWLGGAAYAGRFHALAAQAQASGVDDLETPKPSPSPRQPREAAVAAQRDFIRSRLVRDHLYPLLWTEDS